MAIRNANRAKMIALDQQEFDGHAAILRKLGRIRGNGHAVLNRSGAGGEKAVDSLHFHDAQAASADGRQSLHVAERRDEFAAGLGRLQDSLALERADQLAIDPDG